MTQIVVTLEDGTNFSIIRNAIKMIKGVKNAIVTHIDIKNSDINNSKNQKAARMQAFDQLAESVSIDMIDTDDERTRYLLGK